MKNEYIIVCVRNLGGGDINRSVYFRTEEPTEFHEKFTEFMNAPKKGGRKLVGLMDGIPYIIFEDGTNGTWIEYQFHKKEIKEAKKEKRYVIVYSNPSDFGCLPTTYDNIEDAKKAITSCKEDFFKMAMETKMSFIIKTMDETMFEAEDIKYGIYNYFIEEITVTC